MRSDATTVRQYLDSLPPDRRKALEAVRKTIRANLDEGFKEGMQYGMIGYFVPHTLYPAGYHCDSKQPLPFASLASQKNHMALYLFCIYADPTEADGFREQWAKTGKKLDMGKGCVRFRRLEDVPLDVIGRTIKRISVKKFIGQYEASRSASRAHGKK